MSTSYGTHLRKTKRSVRKVLLSIYRSGDYYENCAGHPCKATSWYIGKGYGELDGIDLITNAETNCSILSCGPTPISKEEAEERVAYYKANGDDAYQIRYIFNGNKEAFESFNKEWRS